MVFAWGLKKVWLLFVRGFLHKSVLATDKVRQAIISLPIEKNMTQKNYRTIQVAYV